MAWFKRRIIGEDLVVRDDNVLAVAPSSDQDPILDHAAGVAKSITVSAAVFTPPAGCKHVDFYASADVWVRTDDAAAAVPSDGMAGGTPTFVGAGTSKPIGVTAGKPLRAVSVSGAALVVVTPYKARS